jgi:hypothetical protein
LHCFSPFETFGLDSLIVSFPEEFDENMIEMDDDCKLDIEIPGEFRSMPEVINESKKRKRQNFNYLLDQKYIQNINTRNI